MLSASEVCDPLAPSATAAIVIHKGDEPHPAHRAMGCGRRVRNLGGEVALALVIDEREAPGGGRESGWLPEAGSLLVVTIRIPVGLQTIGSS